MKQFEADIKQYTDALTGLIQEKDLPGEWFQIPDHLAVKCADFLDYRHTKDFWRRYAVPGGVSQARVGERFIASVLLSEGNHLELGPFDHVEWLEIMQPRPEKEGTDTVGVDHVEFYYPGFRALGPKLDATGVEYKFQKNTHHEWLSILGNGIEVKLNDLPMAQLIALPSEGVGA